MVSGRDASRRRRARAGTLAGVGGILLIVLGIVLTLLEVGGLILPTVLAILGVGSLLAGVASGSMLVAENFRLSRSQSDSDER